MSETGSSTPDGLARGARVAVTARPPTSSDPRGDSSAPDTAAAPRRAPETESEYHARWIDLARREPGSLEESIDDVLVPGRPACEQVAFLRALYEIDSEEVVPAFAGAIRELPRASSPHADSVPSFAVRYLGERAARDPVARGVLEEVAFPRERNGVEGALRRRAASYWAATATADELSSLAEHMARESDPLLTDGVRAALARNPHRQAAREALARLGAGEPLLHLPDPATERPIADR